jgi:hypothetical protein
LIGYSTRSDLRIIQASITRRKLTFSPVISRRLLAFPVPPSKIGTARATSTVLFVVKGKVD